MAVSAGWRFKSAAACIVAAAFCYLVGCQTTTEPVNKVVFYQPLNQDKAVSAAQWQQVFSQLVAQGYTGIVVQWTRYGDDNFMAADSPLPTIIQLSQQHQLRVWLGLSSDNDYFNRMAQPELQKKDYFRQQLALNMLQFERLRHLPLVTSDLFAGWYLPLELNDSDFQSTAYQQWLLAELSQFAKGVGAPVALSVFSNGSLELAVFLQALQNVSETGLHLWLQDGAGAGLLTAKTRHTLLSELPCTTPVIIERFRLTDDATPFFARSATDQEQQLADNAIKPCQDKFYFSLRYLPLAQGLLTIPAK